MRDTPVAVSFGTYIANWVPSPTKQLTYVIGSRAQTSAASQMVTAFSDGSIGIPTALFALDATSYGGFYVKSSNVQSTAFAFSPHPSDQLGTYHVFVRAQTAQAPANLGKVGVFYIEATELQAYELNTSGFIDYYQAPTVAPFAAQNTWTTCDLGQIVVPAYQRGDLADLSQNYATVGLSVSDANGSPAAYQINWAALVPVDGGTLLGTIQPVASNINTQWLWAYNDARTTGMSLETAARANPARMAGGPGSYTASSINVNPAADLALTLDPTRQVGSVAVNQFAALMTDQAGGVYPLVAEIVYSPRYLYAK